MAKMRVDAHQHFWQVGRFPYPWMPPASSPLRADFLPSKLAPILQRNRFDGSVVVQAATSADETRWLLELASAHEFIRGVVGWADLTDPLLGDVLDEFQRHPKFKGVRHPAHDEPDLHWLLRQDVIAGLRELARRDLPFDLLLRPPHLPMLPKLADSVPGLRMVLDHIAKPLIAAQVVEPWAKDMEHAAAIPGMYAKLSGMITEAAADWKPADLKPYVVHVFGLFGPDRLMFGSDWPVCLPADTWKEVLAAFTQAIGPQAVPVRERLLGETACRFYRLTAR